MSWWVIAGGIWAVLLVAFVALWSALARLRQERDELLRSAYERLADDKERQPEAHEHPTRWRSG